MGGRITDEPAIVAAVENLAKYKQGQSLEPVSGVPVDVRQATSMERIRASQPGLCVRIAAATRPEATIPSFEGEQSDFSEEPTAESFSG